MAVFHVHWQKKTESLLSLIQINKGKCFIVPLLLSRFLTLWFHCRFIPEPWSPCSASCGRGVQTRDVKCRIYLAFTQTEVELPDEECEDTKPVTERSCHLESCDGDPVPFVPEPPPSEDAADVVYGWEYIGFTPCSATCTGGIIVCL